MRLQQHGAERGAQRQGNENRDDRRGGDCRGELSEEEAGDPADESSGINTAHSVSAMAISAPETSSIVLCAASLAPMPKAMFRSTFSTTTMASSTTMPTAQDEAEHRQVIIEMPSRERIVKVPTSEIEWRPRE